MCFSLSLPAEPPEDQMNAPSASNPLSKTLDGYQLVPSFPIPTGSCTRKAPDMSSLSASEENPTRHDPPPPSPLVPHSSTLNGSSAPALAAAEDIYSRNSDKEAQREDPEPSSPFRLLNNDLSNSTSSHWFNSHTSGYVSSSQDWCSSHSYSSRVSKEEAWDPELSSEENWLTTEDAGTPSRNAFSAAAVVPSIVGAGLANLGNTCFINAILQCFTHTVPLIQGLRSCSHSAPCDGGIDGFCVICALCDHFERSLATSGRILSPFKIVHNLNHFSSTFRRYQQEDAHEFMQCALDKLERCFLDLKKNSKSFEDDNLVEKVFGGRLISKLQCCNCGHSSDTYEPLIDLSLEIENVDSLPSALESFTMVEKIDAKFRCDSCKEEVSMEKQLMLDQTPSVAAFHLKRFKTDGTYVEKIDNHVDFPLELDLQPYTISNHNNNVPLKYDLYAVVVHIGFSSTSGHYFCFVRSAPDVWHRLDDAKVTRVLGDSVLSQEAYILFYARQGTPWFSSIIESPRPCLDPSILSTSPKSVLDNVDSMYRSHPIITENIIRGEDSESKEFAQKSDYSCEERHKLLEVNYTVNASPDCGQVLSSSNQESVGFDGSRDATHTQMPFGNNAILNGSVMFDGNSYESGVLDKNNCCKEVDIGENCFRPLTPPSSPTPDAPDRSYHIPRDHLKMENCGSCKKASNKSLDDSKRKELVSYVKKSMLGSRRDKFLELVDCNSEASLNKKRKKMDSSLCKKGSPYSVRKKSNHSSVMHPVATGFSR